MVEAHTVSLATALERATQLLAVEPARASRQAEEVLRVHPGEPRARFVIGAARRRSGDAVGARQVLEPLAAEQPGAASVHFELAQALASLGERKPAIVALRRSLSIRREDPDAWRLLADLLTELCETAAADAAYAEYLKVSAKDPTLQASAVALGDERLAEAERLLRARLERTPTDIAAMRMLAELATRLGRFAEAQRLLERCLDLAPGYIGARHNYAVVLYRRQKAGAALAQVDRLLTAEPHDPSYRILKAAILALLGDFTGATVLYEAVLAAGGFQPKIWLSYGHALRATGRTKNAVTAYRRAIQDGPPMGEAYWSLANLKTRAFSAIDETDIQRFLANTRLAPDDRLHLAFTLGKVLEDRNAWADAFQQYQAGAAVHRRLFPFDIAAMRSQTQGSKALFSKGFLAERTGGGAASSEPIFIVGLPRSGSTLIEQILASHSMVEGTFELPDIIAIARDLGGEGIDDPLQAVEQYLAAVKTLAPDERRRLGETYLGGTAIHRKLGRPRFIDKMPNNARYIGLIHLILPNAKIIDARRHPMAAGFSSFKQHFARGYRFTYDLDDLGRYYADYVNIMAHFDDVLPGRVHRVIYEDLVTDTEAEVRRLLHYLDLPFEEGCLRFHETRRAVRTASSEQVRRPIYREGLDHWRNFEPWLGPLKEALGPALETWRGRR